jgi:integrase
MMGDLRMRDFIQAGEMTFAQAAFLYQEARYENRFLSKIILYFGPRTVLSEIDGAVLMQAAHEIYPDAQPSTRKRQVITPAKAVISFATGMRPDYGSSAGVRSRWLMPEEAEKLLSAAWRCERIGIPDTNRNLHRLISFLLGTGVRPGEAFAVESKHFDQWSSKCLIAGERIGAGKTPGSARTVWLPEKIRGAFEVPLPDGPLFRSPSGHPYSLRPNGGGQIAYHFNKIRASAGLGKDVTPYTLRHTFATYYYALTKDLLGLMDRGGWVKADTANRYRKAAPDNLIEELQKYGWDFGQDDGQR